jgi:DNA-binding CsgD family transcriptional regulator
MTSEELLDEAIRLLAILVRQGVETQTEAIVDMNRAGLSTSRIAELLGTTSNTVNVTITRSKKSRSE